FHLILIVITFFFFFSSRRRHTRFSRDWSSDVCSSDLPRRGGCQRLAQLVALRGTRPNRHRASLAAPGRKPSWRRSTCRSPRACRSEERRVGKECRSRWWACH